jgi:hypothetical protein
MKILFSTCMYRKSGAVELLRQLDKTLEQSINCIYRLGFITSLNH